MARRQDGGYYSKGNEVFMAPNMKDGMGSMGFRVCQVDDWIVDNEAAARKIANALNDAEKLPRQED